MIYKSCNFNIYTKCLFICTKMHYIINVQLNFLLLKYAIRALAVTLYIYIAEIYFI